MSKTHLTRIRFAALHRKIVDTCYPDEEQRTTVWHQTEASFYGFGDSSNPESISGKMTNKLNVSVNGRNLYNYKNLYNQQHDFIPISNRYLKYYLDFINLPLSELDEIARDYQENTPGFPTKTIRSDRVHKSAARNHSGPVGKVGDPTNLVRLCQNSWWFYFYEYNDTETKSLIRLILDFHKEGDGRYAVKLKNSGAPYTDFAGWVTHATNDNLVCTLTGGKRAMTITFRVERTGMEDLYTGIYLKHDLKHSVRSGSVLIHRIKKEYALPLNPQIFKQGSKELHQIPKGIAEFFSEKRYVHLKTPSLFNEGKLLEWIKRKQDSRKLTKKTDLFVSATILSAKEKRDYLKNIKEAIGSAVLDFIDQHDFPTRDPASMQTLLHQVAAAQKLDISNQFPTEGAFADFSSFHTEVQRMNKRIALEIEEIDQSRICYSFAELPPGGFLHQEPKLVLERDFDLLSSSKGMMIICPYNRVFSSCWVLAGRAITLGIPTFLVYRHEENLPYNLRQANKYDHVHMLKLREENLDAVPLWFKHNNFGPRYFR